MKFSPLEMIGKFSTTIKDSPNKYLRKEKMINLKYVQLKEIIWHEGVPLNKIKDTPQDRPSKNTRRTG